MQNQERTKFHRFTRAVKWLSVAYILGAVSGGTIYSTVANTSMQQFENLALSGNCLHRDIQHSLFWLPCGAMQAIDAFVAERTQREMQEADYTQAEEIADDIISKKKNHGGRK